MPYGSFAATKMRRSREGAWIEILLPVYKIFTQPVAPARERGLKFILWYTTNKASCVAPARERGLKLYLHLVI